MFGSNRAERESKHKITSKNKEIHNLYSLFMTRLVSVLFHNSFYTAKHFKNFSSLTKDII
jgi:hypothetical protein